MDWLTADKLASDYGDAFYLFHEQRFISNFENLLSAFASHYAPTRIAYSYKTNYTPDICSLVNRLGGYAEVVSDMEFWLARRLGIDPFRIVYNGPCKSELSLCEALRGGALINLDSIRDLRMAVANSSEFIGSPRPIALRCNFAINGLPLSRFGLDIDGEDFKLAIETLATTPGLRLAGLHCHFPNRDLASFIERADRMIDLARRIFPSPPDFINLGGGYYSKIPSSIRRTMSSEPPNFAHYGDAIGRRFAEAFPDETTHRPTLIIEPGTALVADTFQFFARVLDVKMIRGRRIATVAGSIFNISPSARSTNLPIEILSRPGRRPHDAEFDIAGYTCIEGDYLSKNVTGSISAGDFIAYGNVGSYSIVMKPPFILPNAAILSLGPCGEARVLRPRETADNIFGLFTGCA